MAELTLTRRPSPRVEQRMISEHIGWTFLVLTIFAGATYTTFAKSLTLAFSPISLIFVSELLTLFFLLLSFGFIPTVKEILRVRRHMLLPLFIVGLFSGTLGPLLFFTGLFYTSAINGSLFGNSETVFTILLAVLILSERWTPSRTIAAVAIFTGVITIALQGFTVGITLQWGDTLILLGCLCFSIGSITFRRYLHNSNPEIAMISRSLVAIAIFFLLSPFEPQTFLSEVRAFPLSLLTALIGFGFISKFLNVFSFYQALERLPVSTVSLVGSTGVVVSVAFAHWLLSEPIFLYHIVGGILIVGGTVILEAMGLRHTRMHLKQRHHHRA